MPLIEKSEAKPSGDDWDLLFLPNLIGGLNTFYPPHNIELTQLSKSLNVRPNMGHLDIDYGYNQLGQDVVGNPRFTYPFLRSAGTIDNILITNLTVYIFANAVQKWHYISNGTSTTLTAGEAGGATVMDVVSSVGFAAGERVGIFLDNGNQHQTTVAGTGAGTITINDALPSAAAAGKIVLEAVLLAGVDDRDVVVAPHAPTDKLFITNGVDLPKVYDGTTIATVSGLPAGLTTARIVATFNNYILLIYVTEGGIVKPTRIRRCDTGDPTNWTTGNAGFDDLKEFPDAIVGAHHLVNDLFLYREGRITKMSFTGSEDKVFDYEDMIHNEGVKSFYSVVDMDTYHMVLGKNNIYQYNGGYDIAPMAQEIQFKLFGRDGEILKTVANRSFLTRFFDLEEGWIFYPSGSDSFPSRQVKFSRPYSIWSARQFPHNFSGHGYILRDSDVPWSGLSGTWGAQTLAWADFAKKDIVPSVVLCGSTPNRVYEYGFASTDDDGAQISFQVDTAEFFSPNGEMRFDRFSVRTKGVYLSISYSIDEGATWVPLKTFNLTSSYATYRIFKQFVTERIRFRFSGHGAGSSLEWFSARLKKETLQQ